MEMVSKPCQDRFLYLVHTIIEKRMKIQVAKWGTPRAFEEKRRGKKKNIYSWCVSENQS